MKKIISLTIAVALVFGLMAGCGGSSGGGPAQAPSGTSGTGGDSGSYINMESQWPIVNEPITLKVTMPRSNFDSVGTPNNRWFWKWITEKSGINFEFNLIDEASRDEKVNLMFASDDLTDIMIMLSIKNDEVAKYAGKEQMLMPMNDLIDAYAPDIKKWFEEYPNVQANSTYVDGNIYTLPVDSGPEYGQFYYTLRGWINEEWLQTLGMDVPETLDDLYETLVAFRDKDPNGNGTADEIPISYEPGGLNRYIYSALGVILGGGTRGGVYSLNDQSFRPAMYNGEPMIPVNNPEVYRNYITFLNKLYSEKLMDPDTYTLTSTQVQAKAADNTIGVHFAHGPHVLLSAGYETWISLAPLTSEWNSTKMWPRSENFAAGAFALSSDCAYPEAAIRFANWLFTPEAAMYSYYGPPKDSEDLLEGYEGWWFDGDQGPNYNLPDLYKDNTTYMCSEVSMWAAQHPGIAAPSWGIQQIMDFSPAEGSPGASQHWRKAMNAHNIKDYYTEVYPPVYYDVETNDRLKELETPISDYVKNMEAKFVTGTEPLENLDKFFGQLKNLGIDEIEQIYKDAYTSYKAVLG